MTTNLNTDLENDHILHELALIIPAHNEENDLPKTLQSISKQTVKPGLVVVVADNCSDRTVEIAKAFNVTVVETIDNKHKKAGALNYGWNMVNDYEYVATLDADTILEEEDFIEKLLAQLKSDPNVAGIMPRYTVQHSNLLERMQMLEFASTTLELLRRGCHTHTLGGQFSLFRNEILKEIKLSYGVWSHDSVVEDMELTVRLWKRGYRCAVSSDTRAAAGGMFTLMGLWSQRRKWEEGILRILFENKIEKFLYLPYLRTVSSVFDLWMRFILLSMCFVNFNYIWLWLITIITSIDYKAIYKAPDIENRWKNMLLSTCFFEFYTFHILCVKLVSLFRIIERKTDDLWKKQHIAEKSKSKSLPVAYCVLVLLLMLVFASVITIPALILQVSVVVLVIRFIYRLTRSDSGYMP
ncbi:hypothetical protein GCM10023206_06770 [Acinetobacter puyangensis]|uniref:Glycosyltransferase, catalytic subunit of cellulose synthase and poly-beta-1,6-N-acetylglucosamine synthase n=1 Tax=Acinetobacter puyangensis TaxID=1096779 RepID=A0A240E654_9GAMM|nr:glycosyltransferase family 2 protein [Acinetobacter puyangensis]SNX44244.1 Glycosyltransferase, catalytic subunit of cellulose synthase and poly-beta-1,6-N-acetylglucosamine synthase [Acinetobacter puyangensis]